MAATYPVALKVFSTFHDYTDVIWAWSVNEIHDEIVQIETVLGTSPFTGTPYTTFGGAIQDLYANKAPSTHTHTHKTLLDDNQGNDHPQYIQVNGYPGFSYAVSGQPAWAGSHLLPLGQLQSFGYQNAAQVQAAVNAALGNLMSGAFGGAPIWGSTPAPTWKVQGGYFTGITDGSGRITVPFASPYSRCVQAFVATKTPPQAGPGTPYNWVEAQVTLVAVTGTGAMVQFSHDYSWQPNMKVSFTWLAIGN
jgi:hypothetical protein